MFSQNLQFIFVVLTIEMYPILHFVVQFSESYFQGSRLHSVSVVRNGYVE
jgi:hypothetical protein